MNIRPRQLIATAAVVLLMTSAVAAASEAGSEAPFVFVGRLIAIQELPDPCDAGVPPEEGSAGGETICLSMDGLFEARYEVVEAVIGYSESREVTFRIADHYGFPRFADYRHALLFVNIKADGSWLEKYQGYAVHRTQNGRWAACGNPYDERAGDNPRFLRAVSFENDFGSVGEFSREGVARRFEGTHFEIAGDRIVCRQGIYLPDLYDVVRRGVLAARGIELPELPHRQ